MREGRESREAVAAWTVYNMQWGLRQIRSAEASLPGLKEGGGGDVKDPTHRVQEYEGKVGRGFGALS